MGVCQAVVHLGFCLWVGMICICQQLVYGLFLLFLVFCLLLDLVLFGGIGCSLNSGIVFLFVCALEVVN